jgi:hypothetical protein
MEMRHRRKLDASPGGSSEADETRMTYTVEAAAPGLAAVAVARVAGRLGA